MLILKITLTIMVGLFGYLTTGIILYVKSKGAQAFSIPVSLAWCYSSIGLLITLASYFFVHNIYYYYSPSKKHTVRYWKAIHSIRHAFKTLYPNISSFLVMPDSINNPQRPRLSRRWEQGILIYPLYHLLFFFIFALFLSPFFAPIDPDAGVVIPSADLIIFKKALTLLWPLLLLRLATGVLICLLS
jgi:sterol desaturase/sphingolipid hydroxylase (fatty acid hydroxylase superfamily)